MEIDLEKLIKSKMSLYSFLICWSIYNEEQDMLVNYVTSVDRIDTEHFKWLVNEGYLETIDLKSITIDNLKLTDKFEVEMLGKLSSKQLTFDEAFQELRTNYPKATPEDRKLQGDVTRCKNLYTRIIVKNSKVDMELHQRILNCITLEKNSKIKNRKQEYWKMLATYLQQRGWEEYIDNLPENTSIVNEIKDSGEGRTMLGSEDF